VISAKNKEGALSSEKIPQFESDVSYEAKFCSQGQLGRAVLSDGVGLQRQAANNQVLVGAVA
jgi:hypothetical protein